ncbi:MAG TPA: coagulation factor 5/8 type domain-containing protein, partial [Thermoanaerobaculia bacterium]
KDAPRGAYPRYLAGEQSYWTVIGADGANDEALVGEDGNVEPFKGGDSIEPVLIVKGKRLTWADVQITHSLADGDLPIPSVTWKARGASMTLTAAVSSSSMLQLRYRVHGDAKLDLQVRPFQVNPSTQFLNLEGGVSHVHSLVWPRASARGVRAKARTHTEEREVDIPLQPNAQRESFEKIAADWREKLNRVKIEIGGAPQIAETIRSSVAYMLIHRDGPALKPGSRSYDRAWIRDGALMGSLLLRLGHVDAAKEFGQWFAGFQYPDGKVPCCVDDRGADPVPENDSHGELIFLVAEIDRVTHDVDFVRKLWPNVDRAASYINTLRSSNHGDFEGLVTESISHEGYSAKPVHSYWDDMFCLKGVEDAAMLAGVLGLDARQRELQSQAEDFRRALNASIERTMEQHHLDYVPASAELGDFDPTSTSIAISPLNLTSLFPAAALRRTYDLYFEHLAKPRDDYTPYEMRTIGALIRLGDRDRALQLVDRFLRDRRPAPWNEWAEVVRTEYRKPGFIGDMPHAWVASDFVRSMIDAVAYDSPDGTLVIGAGVPARWLPLHVGPLPMNQGTIDVRMHRDGRSAVVEVSGDARNVIIVSPFDVTKTKSIGNLPARVVFEQ